MTETLIQVQLEELKSKLSTLNKVVEAKPIHPILGCICAEVEEKSLKLTTYNLVTQIDTEINLIAKPISLGLKRIAIPSRLFTETIKRLPKGIEEIEITFAKKTNDEGETIFETVIGADANNILIACHDASDFITEQIDIEKKKESIQAELVLKKQELLDGLNATLFAASNDETRPLLKGCNIETKGDVLKLQATNGHHLKTISFSEIEGDLPEISITIGTESLTRLLAMLEQVKDFDIKVFLLKEEVIFYAEQEKELLSCRSQTEKYPNVSQLIPTEYVSEFILETEKLYSSLNLLSLLVQDQLKLVHLKKDRETLEIDSSRQEKGQGLSYMAVKQREEKDKLFHDFSVKIKLDYLISGIRSFNSKLLILKYTAPEKPIIITSYPSEKELYLVMPCA